MSGPLNINKYQHHTAPHRTAITSANKPLRYRLQHPKPVQTRPNQTNPNPPTLPTTPPAYTHHHHIGQLERKALHIHTFYLYEVPHQDRELSFPRTVSPTSS
ncbi:hypothetical protein VTL71DRAFT_4255 [Oculimacula yallundae]|uniref:Uncharacterized protein n=1 Tax=Oculimacula yallundae TaxID=86028 RepID=A0ABR4C599_9HELO